MSEADEIRQAYATILKLIEDKSPWIKGKEREFNVVESTLHAIKSEYSYREAKFREEDHSSHFNDGTH